MMPWKRLTRLQALVLLVALFAMWPSRLYGQEAAPVTIRINVTDSGFAYNGQSGDITIEVEEGALVELTFVWAHEAYVLDEHIITLEGYGLESDKIDFHNRETTIRFIANRPGTFTFTCTVQCDSHDYLQNGHLHAARSGLESQSAAFTPTILEMSPSSWVATGRLIVLTTTLRDTDGAPVPRAEVRFNLEAEFAGVEGPMEIGRARTDADGVAFFNYQPTLNLRQHRITAHFDGMGIYDESQHGVQIDGIGEPPSAHRPVPLGLEAIRPWAPAALLAVVIVIWMTFAYVLYQVYAIARSGAEE
jgi:hypothetical protein